jgi:hypothetical protein
VVHELRAATYQRPAGADDGHVSPEAFASVLERVQELRIKTCQSGQVLDTFLDTYFIRLALALA